MRALVLSGGASKGAYQAGALARWIGEEGIDYDIFTGVSVGAINATALAQFKTGDNKIAIEYLIGFWERITKTSDVHKSWWNLGSLGYLHGLFGDSLRDARPLRKLLSQGLDVGRIRSSGKKLAIGATCLETGEYRYIRETDADIIDFVYASAAFPIFFEPLKRHGLKWADGGLRSTTPIGQAIKMGATEIDLILCSGMDWIEPWQGKTAIDTTPRAVGLMSDEILRLDVKIVGLKNDMVKLNPKYKHVSVRLLAPRRPITNDVLNFDREEIERMMNIGYEESANPEIIYL